MKKLTTLIGAALLACGAYAQSTLNIITGTNVVIATTNIGGTNINMQISAVPGGGAGEVTTSQLLIASNDATALSYRSAGTIFYDTFTQSDSFGTTNWVSDSGQAMKLHAPTAGFHERGYITNGLLGLDASTNASTYYLYTSLSNMVKGQPFKQWVRWRYNGTAGTEFSESEAGEFTMACTDGGFPNWTPMSHVQCLDQVAYFTPSMWTNTPSGIGSLQPASAALTPLFSRLRSETNGNAYHLTEVTYWMDNTMTIAQDGWSTNFWHPNLDQQLGTNFYWQISNDPMATARKWVEFDAIGIELVPDRRIPEFAGRYGPGITNASGVPAAALDAGANVTLTTNGNRISIAAAAGTGADSTNATDVGTNVVFKGDIQATNATVGSLTIVGTGTNVLNGETRVTGNLRVVETNYAKAVVADYFSGPSTGPGTLTVNGTISSLTNNTGHLTASNELTVGTTNVIGSIANLNGQSNQWALLTWANSISNLVQTKQNGDADLTNWAAITTASKQESNGFLTTISGLASKTFTNVPLGGSNISVRTTGGTNFIDTTGNLNNWAGITTASKQESNSVLGNLVASGVEFPSSKLASNVNNVVFNSQTLLVFTNNAMSNIVVNLRTNCYEINLTNNATLTNFTGVAAGQSLSTVLFITPRLINRGIAWPASGGVTYDSIRFWTNANSPLWTTLTADVRYAISLMSIGTNVHATITEWK